MIRPRVLLLVALTWLVVHSIIWVLVANFESSLYPWPTAVRSMFEYWDAWHYSAIASEGYSAAARWAFYPLYPLLIRILTSLVGLRTRPDIVGAVFSTLTFAAFCLIQARLVASPDERLRALKPETIWGWLFFLCWPASWVFHSHHTESLFLLLSFCAFLSARNGRWWTAGILAGLCALTRNQGVFVAAAVALHSASQQDQWRRKILVFGGSGLISFLLFACWPVYQYMATGNALMAINAQAQFAPQALSFHQFVGTIWFANSWQHPTWSFYLHHVFFILLNVAIGLLLWRREFTLALYVCLSLWVPLYLGQLENTFRYGAILFPALFLLGETTRRFPRSICWALFAALIWLNLVCTRDYALGVWAY